MLTKEVCLMFYVLLMFALLSLEGEILVVKEIFLLLFFSLVTLC